MGYNLERKNGCIFKGEEKEKIRQGPRFSLPLLDIPPLGQKDSSRNYLTS